jgi:threonine aldolase
MANTLKSQQFASDNYSGICPEAFDYLTNANAGHVVAYGDDKWTAEAADMFRDIFQTHCEVFFVFNGTAGNSLSLASLCQSYHSIICHRFAHIETDECGAPEFFPTVQRYFWPMEIMENSIHRACFNW